MQLSSRLLLALAAIAVLGAGTPASPPILVVAASHDQVGESGRKAPLTYRLRSTARLVVDTRTYDFTRSLYPTVRPNAIHLLSAGGKYSAPWNPSGLTELSPATLTPYDNSPPFTSLQAGTQVMIAVGQQRTDPKDHALVLKLLWASTIEVHR